MTNESRPDPLIRDMSNLREILETRLNAIDRSISLAHEDAVRVPTDIDKAVGHLKELHQEKFEAAEKAVDRQNGTFVLSLQKTEESLTKQIESLALARDATTRAIESQVSDLKDRVTRIESFGIGQSSANTSSQTQSNWQVGIVVSVLLAAGAIIVSVLK